MSQWQPKDKPKTKLSEVMEAEAPAVELVVKEATETVEPEVPKSMPGEDQSTPTNAPRESDESQTTVESTPGATATSHDKTTAHSGETPPDLGPRYDVIELVGSGGMGTVWKVFDKQLAETFAIKVLKPELISDATALKRFEKEANLASDLTHANIAAIFGPGTDDKGRPYIIMRFVDGESLADILAREGKFSEERALDIFSQICEALSHSHMKGIVHRDIKPSNIIISKTESGGDMVHIVDFGIARCVYDEVTKTQALTKAVDIFGSPRYMSPEQLLGQTVTEKSDIYSLGCVLYEMLTGAPPFTEDNPVKLILQHINESPDLSQIHPRLHLLLHACLGKEPTTRIQNIGFVQNTLSQVDSMPPIVLHNLSVIHCIGPVLVMTVQITQSHHSSTYSDSSIYPFLMFTIAWLYLATVNRLNAAPSKHYVLIELNLLIAAISSVIFAIATSFLPNALTLLVVLTNLALSCWYITKSNAAENYEILVRGISNSLNGSNFAKPKVLNKNHMRVSNICLRGIVYLLPLIPGFLVVTPLLALFCGNDLNISPTNSNIWECITGFIAISMTAALEKLALEMLVFKATMQESLKNSAKWIGISVILSGVTTFAINALWANGDLYRYNRQDIAEMAAPQERARVQLEALRYPDTEICNRARFIAANAIYSDKGNLKDAVTLCTQIIDSKASADPNLLIEAHLLRAKLAELNQTPSATTKTDLTQALALLSAKPVNQAPNLQLLGPFRSRASQAIRMGKRALASGDIALSQQAVRIAKETTGLNRLLQNDLENLETQIEDHQIKSNSTTSGALQQ